VAGGLEGQAPPEHPVTRVFIPSGRPDSNWRPSPWQFARPLQWRPLKDTNAQVRVSFGSQPLSPSRAVSQPFAGFLRGRFPAELPSRGRPSDLEKLVQERNDRFQILLAEP
jgi:hypothetical protein